MIVVGAGHAGTEAAVAAARAGARVAIVTSALETIGQMSCNPAIGGVAKGTVVREVDALGGIMGRATDLASLQFRMLNRSKGPAVWAPRAQCDRGLYRRAVRTLLEEHESLQTIQGTVARLIIDEGAQSSPASRRSRGGDSARATVVITTGTFLRGRIHIGTDTQNRRRTRRGVGRDSSGGTIRPTRVWWSSGSRREHRRGSMDGRSTSRASSDRRARSSSSTIPGRTFWPTARRVDGVARHPAQLPCWITFLGEPGKEIIQTNIAASAMYGGAISSRGPRYCPSVEDKIVKFPAAERHQLFLEPEGHDTSELYVNGLSTSLPAPVQLEVLHSVPGLESGANDARRVCDRVRLLSADAARRDAPGEGAGRAVFRRTDQRDDGLRRGRGPGRRRRAERGAPRAWPAPA